MFFLYLKISTLERLKFFFKKIYLLKFEKNKLTKEKQSTTGQVVVGFYGQEGK